MLPYLIKFCTISSKPSYGSSHWGAGVLFPGLAIKWKQSQGAGWLYRSGPTHVPMYIPIGILHWSMLCAYARNPVTHNHVVVAFVICIVLYCIVMYVLYHFVFLIIKKKKNICVIIGSLCTINPCLLETRVKWKSVRFLTKYFPLRSMFIHIELLFGGCLSFVGKYF